MTRSRTRWYRFTGAAMLRAAVNLSAPDLPAWPGPAGRTVQWRDWLAPVWADEAFRRAVTDASPGLARQVDGILDARVSGARRARRAALAVARYAIRYARRSTPFGLFAGVALVEFGPGSVARVGEAHEVSARPDPVCVDSAIREWATDPARMSDVDVRVNTLARIHGERVLVPSEGAAEFSLALTPVLALVLEAAKSPVRHAALLGKLAAEYPQADEARRVAFIADLLKTGLLLSALRAPATVTDPASVLPAGVLDACGGAPAAVDVRLDAEVRIPETVVAELETAATVLARLTAHPHGTPAWRRYLERFADRWGEGGEVGLEQLTDPGKGLGLPDGFAAGSEPPRPMSRRDRLLLGIAGTAACEGARTVPLSEPDVEELEAAAGGPAHVRAPHFEVCAQLEAASLPALDRGDFRVRIQTVSRAAGTMTGRFWHLLPAAAAGFSGLPALDAGAQPAQLSFHPARVSADLLTRAPQVLPRLVSVGEFRAAGASVLVPADLAVGLRGGHLYLVVAATGERIELLAPTAINFVWNNVTPPLVRFLAELSRAATPQVTGFDWGAAWTLPYTPALRYRRAFLAPARWQLRARSLPGRAASLQQWATQLHAWRARAAVPARVVLAVDDQHLPLDLARDQDLDLLRAHLGGAPVAVLQDAPPPEADGWIGGRAHSIAVPVESIR